MRLLDTEDFVSGIVSPLTEKHEELVAEFRKFPSLETKAFADGFGLCLSMLDSYYLSTASELPLNWMELLGIALSEED